MTDECPTPFVSVEAMETPTLFDPVHPSSEGSLAAASMPTSEVDRDRAQRQIRRLNEDRLSRQDDEQRVARRRAAIARLRRRVSTADEVEIEYWEQRRATLSLIG